MLPKQQQQQQTNSNIINQSSPSMTAIKSTQKCAQLQIPGQESSTTSTSTSKRISPSPSSSSFIIMNDNNYNDGDGNNNQIMKQTKSGSMIDIKDFFDDNYNQDKLKCYTQIIDSYRWFRMKSFSTTDILMTTMSNGGGGQIWSDNQQQPWCSSPMINNINNNINNNRKYLSDCNLNDYYRFINMNDKQCIKDYITYSCSTLAICGDTIHSSSQLPSPSQAQSFRQLNSTSLIFSDIDLAKSMNRKILNDAIKQRLNEFIKVLGNTMNETLTENELINIDEISSDIVMKPIKMMINNDFPAEEYTTGDILINVVNYEQQNDIKSFTKKDKEKFVLNWLQTVETTTGIMEPN